MSDSESLSDEEEGERLLSNREFGSSQRNSFGRRAVCLVGILGCLSLIGYLWMRHSSSIPVNKSMKRSGGTSVGERPLVTRITTTTTTTTRPGQCNPSKPFPDTVHANFIKVKDQWWSNHCATINSRGYWQPPASLNFHRNFCWAAMKEFAQMSAWKSKDITPENWWWAQMRASKKDLAPSPEQEILYPLHHPEVCDIPGNGGNFGPVISKAERRNASEWLNRTVAVYVVNLDRAWKRMNAIGARLGALGIEFTRIAGVDISAIGVETAQSDGLVPASWNQSVANENLWKLYGESNKPSIYNEVAGPGTIGCAAAHLKALREAEKLSRQRRTPLALILEDDVWLYDDFAVNLRRMLEQEAPCDWEAISLKSYNPVGECISPHLSRVWPDGNEPGVACHRAANWGFQSMLYRVDSLDYITRQLSKLVWDVERPTCLVQDIALATTSDSIKYYAVPASQWPGFFTFMRDGAGWREALNR